MMHFSLVLLSLGPIVCIMADGLTIDNTEAGSIAEAQGQVPDTAQQLSKTQPARRKAGREGEVEQLNLLEDTTARFTVKELRISGNTLISTDELLKTMPLVYNASNKPLHQAATRLRELAAVLHDTDGSHIVALGRVVNEFVNTAVPPSPEQFASISQALAGGGEGTHYATAGQWLDTLTEYVAILVGDIGWPADESVAFAMGKYGPSVTEAGTISVTAFIQLYLEGLTG